MTKPIFRCLLAPNSEYVLNKLHLLQCLLDYFCTHFSSDVLWFIFCMRSHIALPPSPKVFRQVYGISSSCYLGFSHHLQPPRELMHIGKTPSQGKAHWWVHAPEVGSHVKYAFLFLNRKIFTAYDMTPLTIDMHIFPTFLHKTRYSFVFRFWKKREFSFGSKSWLHLPLTFFEILNKYFRVLAKSCLGT